MDGRFPSMALESEFGCQLYKIYVRWRISGSPSIHRARVLGVSESSHDVRKRVHVLSLKSVT